MVGKKIYFKIEVKTPEIFSPLPQNRPLFGILFFHLYEINNHNDKIPFYIYLGMTECLISMGNTINILYI